MCGGGVLDLEDHCNFAEENAEDNGEDLEEEEDEEEEEEEEEDIVVEKVREGIPFKKYVLHCKVNAYSDSAFRHFITIFICVHGGHFKMRATF